MSNLQHRRERQLRPCGGGVGRHGVIGAPWERSAANGSTATRAMIALTMPVRLMCSCQRHDLEPEGLSQNLQPQSCDGRRIRPVGGCVGQHGGRRGAERGRGHQSRCRAVYVFVANGTTWSQQAFLKGSNTEYPDEFGCSVRVSGDTVVVGARSERSAANGVNGNQSMIALPGPARLCLCAQRARPGASRPISSF